MKKQNQLFKIGVIACIGLAVIAAALILTIRGGGKDISQVLELTFDATAEDVIAYEERIYGNTVYENGAFAGNAKALGFEFNTTYPQHIYSFDEKNGKLTGIDLWEIHVNTQDEGIHPDCSHALEMKERILSAIGEWDEVSDDGLFCYADAKLKDVPVKITFQTSPTKRIRIQKAH